MEQRGLSGGPSSEEAGIRPRLAGDGQGRSQSAKEPDGLACAFSQAMSLAISWTLGHSRSSLSSWAGDQVPTGARERAWLGTVQGNQRPASTHPSPLSWQAGKGPWGLQARLLLQRPLHPALILLPAWLCTLPVGVTKAPLQRGGPWFLGLPGRDGG